MNNSSLLERELVEIGVKLQNYPSIAPTIMERIRELPSTSVVEMRSNRRQRIWSVAAASLSAVAALVTLMLFLRTGSIAFAQVQQKVAAFRTATFRYEERIVKDKTITKRAHVSVVSDGRFRADIEDGLSIVSNRRKGKRLATNSKDRTATISYVTLDGSERNLLEILQGIHVNERKQPIAARTINGEECVGFRIDRPDSIVRVWVSPESILPVYVEFSADSRASGVLSESANENVQITVSFSEIQFGADIADDLFSLQPPEGYAVTEVGQPPASYLETFGASPRLIAKEGVGPIKLGMAESEVLRILGPADNESKSIPPAPSTDAKTVEVDGLVRPSAEHELVVLTEYHSLYYDSLGLRIDFEVHDGLVGIFFDKQVKLGDEADFPGALVEGIGLGASESEVISAYGTPSTIYGEGKSILRYQELGLVFQLTEQKTVRVIGIENPGEKKYRLEWRQVDRQ